MPLSLISPKFEALKALDTLETLDTLLFCAPKHTAEAISALEGGCDQVVAFCVLAQDDGALAQKTALALAPDAQRLDLPLFYDTRCTKDLGGLPLRTMEGAVCLPRQVGFLVKSLPPEATIVVDAGISRHDAITGAESGAHAVLFRKRADQNAADIYPSDDEGPQDVAQLYAWWEQMMQAPAILDLDSLKQPPSWISQVEFVATQATLA